MVPLVSAAAAEQLTLLDSFLQSSATEFANLGILHDWGCSIGVSESKPAIMQLKPPAAFGSISLQPMRTRSAVAAATALTHVNSSASSIHDVSHSMRKLPQDTPLVYQRCAAEILQGGLSCDAVLVGLSDLYSCLRRFRANSTTSTPGSSEDGGGGGTWGREVVSVAMATVAVSGAAWKPPDEFRRSTTKYWVHMNDVTQVKALIVKHLPLLIFGRPTGVSLLTQQLDGHGLKFLQV